MDKNTLRKACLSARDGLDFGVRSSVDKIICDRIFQIVSGSGIVVGGYHAIRSEVNISSALSLFCENSAQVCLPVVVSEVEPLRFRGWKPGVEMVKGKHGILVPPETEAELVPDVVLVPLVGFDSKLNRLGYGAGYYDRTIRALRQQKKSVRIIGVAYSVQRIEQIPADAHDEKLDEVVTEL